MPGPERILVVLTGSLGDVARGLAIVRPLKRGRPGCRLSWVVDSRHAPLVRLHPDVDRVVEFRRPEGIAGGRQLVRELRAERYDVALDLQRIFKSGLIARLSRAPRRIGFHRRDAKELNHLFSTETIAERGESLPKLEQYLDFLTALGLERPERLDFGLSGVDTHALAGRHAASLPARFVALVLGSAWESKDWFAEGYLALARDLAASGRRVVLVGDRSTEGAAAALCSALAGAGVVNLAGATSLSELIGVIGSADACAGPDSGPGHVAAAFDRPYVALFGATSPERTAPWGSADLAIRSPIGCSPCYRRRCPGLGRTCMRLISPAEVFRRLESVT